MALPTTYNLRPAYKNDTWLGPEFKLINIISTHQSGPLVISSEYVIKKYRIGDDFTNVGATVNETATIFTATGETPTTWIKCSVLAKVERINLTNATVRMQIYDGGTLIRTLTSAGSAGITITSAVNGEFQINDFIPTTAGRFTYDLQVVYPDDFVKTYFVGEWVVQADITQNT